MALLATIFVWFLLGSIFICYRIKSGKNQKNLPQASKPLVDMSRCSCKTKTSSKGSSGFFNKFKRGSQDKKGQGKKGSSQR